MSALAAIVAAVDPAVSAHAVTPLPEGRAGGAGDRAFVLEAVYEGQLLHHGRPRAFGQLDPDLSLLGGDELYALGLSRLADAGDLDAIAELAELIALCAWARSERRSEEVVEALWQASERLLLDRSGDGSRAALDLLMHEGR